MIGRQFLSIVVSVGVAGLGAGGSTRPAGIAGHVRDPLPQLSQQPTLILGTLQYGKEDAFVRISGAEVLSDGSVLVADSKTAEIKHFRSDGTFVGRIGRAGEGPGDYRAPAYLGLAPGDSIIVWDGLLSRISFFRSNGTVARLQPVDRAAAVSVGRSSSSGWRDLVGRLTNGNFLAAANHPASNDFTGQRVRQKYFDLITPTGNRRLGEYYFDLYFAYSDPTGTTVLDEVPFAPHGIAATGLATWFYSGGGTPTIQEFTQAGVLVRTITLPFSAEPVTATDIAEFQRKYLAEMTGPQAAYRPVNAAALKQLVYPKVMPAIDGLIVDTSGRLWARQFRNDGRDALWHIVSPTGQYIGAVSLKPECVPSQITANRVIAICGWENDEQLVEIFELRWS